MSFFDFASLKRCWECHIDKPLAEFIAVKANRDGRSGLCNACRKIRRDSSVVKPPPGYVRPRSKTCTACKIDKPLADFSPNRYQWDGRSSQCKLCNNQRRREFAAKPGNRAIVQVWERRARYKYRYGLSQEEFDAMVAAQGNLCAICGKPPKGGKKTKHLMVDHCHETGRIRGCICFNCNTAIGTLGDTVEGLMRAIDYLKRFEDRPKE